MLVKATRLGYYNHRRQKEGSVFKLIDKKSVKYEEQKDPKTGKLVRDASGKPVKKKIVREIKASAQFSDTWMIPLESEDASEEELEIAEAVAEQSSESEQVI